MGFDDFLENDCWPDVRELFKEARRLAKKKGFKVRKGGKGSKGSPGIGTTYAVHFVTKDQEPQQAFFARLSAPNEVQFCLDKLVSDRKFNPRKSKEIHVHLLETEVFEESPSEGEIRGRMNQETLRMFEYVLNEVAAELKRVNPASGLP